MLFDRREQVIAEQIGSTLPTLTANIGTGASMVLEAARLTDARRRTGAEHLRWLQSELQRDPQHSDLPIITVPELFCRAPGSRVVSLIADGLAEELDVGLA